MSKKTLALAWLSGLLLVVVLSGCGTLSGGAGDEAGYSSPRPSGWARSSCWGCRMPPAAQPDQRS